MAPDWQRRQRQPGARIRGLAALAALAAVLALSACGEGPRGVWTKDNVKESQLRRDQKACVAEAGDYDFLTPTSQMAGGGSSAAMRQQGDLYRACMASKGYTELAPGSVVKTEPQGTP